MTEPGPLDELLAHLSHIQDSPNDTRLDTVLVEKCRYVLHATESQPSRVIELAHLILTLLRTSQDDLEPLIRLLSAAIELVPFDDLQISIPVSVVTEGLSSPASSVQNLALTYLRKAAESPSGAAFVANDDDLVKALIKVFLTSKSADIGGTKALVAILSLLSVDNPDKVTTLSKDGYTGQTHGQGLLWRRMFQDEEIYGLFFQLTSASDSSEGLSRADITTAQARLLDFISGVAKMRWDAICDSTKPELQNSQRSTLAHEKSLLRYATLTMVDWKDPLMTNILVDFLKSLLELRNPTGCSGISSIPATSSPSVEFLVSSGLHQRAIDYYLRSEEFDAFEIQFLGGAQTRYFCTYADLYPEHFMQNTDLARSTISHLNRNLQISGARWAHGSVPIQDLNVLAHLPAIALVNASRSDQSPLVLLPTNPANADAFAALGKIFHGPNLNEPETDGNLLAAAGHFRSAGRAASARALFYHYHDKHPEFWSNVGAAMNILAMPKPASAAVGLVKSILTAVWEPMTENTSSSSGPLSSPTEDSLRALCGGNVSRTGMAEIVNAGEPAIQSLLTPLKSLGRDAEAARLAWRLGRDKFDLLVLMAELMRKGVGKDEVPSQTWQSVERRIQEGIRLDAEGGITNQTSLVGTMGS